MSRRDGFDARDLLASADSAGAHRRLGVGRLIDDDDPALLGGRARPATRSVNAVCYRSEGWTSDNTEDSGDSAVMRSLGKYVLAVCLVAVAARISAAVPGTSVPQSAQTLAVVLVGAFLGARDGASALALYLLAGGIGLPVFADGASGWPQLAGPTGGYLVGFVLAAGMVGWFADGGGLVRLRTALVVMVLGHVLILALGWLRLAGSLGAPEAFAAGVAPFLSGGLAKSIVAAVVVSAWMRRGSGASSSSGGDRSRPETH